VRQLGLVGTEAVRQLRFVEGEALRAGYGGDLRLIGLVMTEAVRLGLVTTEAVRLGLVGTEAVRHPALHDSTRSLQTHISTPDPTSARLTFNPSSPQSSSPQSQLALELGVVGGSMASAHFIP
jgi:hypothetical protein